MTGLTGHRYTKTTEPAYADMVITNTYCVKHFSAQDRLHVKGEACARPRLVGPRITGSAQQAVLTSSVAQGAGFASLAYTGWFIALHIYQVGPHCWLI